MKILKSFSSKADLLLESFYHYDIPCNKFFTDIHKLAMEELSNIEELQNLIDYCSFLTEQTFPDMYSLAEAQLHLRSLINLVNIYHDLFLLNSFSTLSDVENIFVLPYKIDRQKYEFEDKLKDILAESIYQYQLTLTSSKEVSGSVQEIIKNLGDIEKELKENIGKMPENYENQRGKVKQLLIKLKEVYKDNIHNDGLSQLAKNTYLALRGNEKLNYTEAHHKLRSVISV